MRTGLAIAIALGLALLTPANALAQDSDNDGFSDDDPDELDMDPDDLGDAVADPFPDGQPDGADEDPTEARLAAEVEAEERVRVPEGDTGYPLEWVARPIVLPSTYSEVRYEARLQPDPLQVGGVLELFYGVTDQVQLALAYGTGTAGDSLVDGESGYEVGRALAIEGVYLVYNYFAVQVEVPFYVDPFAAALTLGARFEYQITEKLRLVTGEDLVTFRLVDFVPTVENALANEANVDAVEFNVNRSRGLLRFPFAAGWQFTPNFALIGEIAVAFDDFDDSEAALSIETTFNYAFTNMFDIGARVGFLDLREVGETFGLLGFAEIRI